MTLLDDINSPSFDSATTTLTEQSSPEAHGDEHAANARSDHEDARSAVADDFASALESFTTETEETTGEDHVITGTVLKLTPTHVFVDIGAKSEGILPLAEVLDPEGKPRFQPGDEIDVVREKGETEEGYFNLSFQKAQRLR